MHNRSAVRAVVRRRDVASLGEDPDVIVGDVADRPRPAAKIIVVANEKGGVGKSTIAFHLSVALADAGLRVAACDLDRRQQSLSSALSRREGTARRLKLDLPRPRHQVLHIHSGAVLCQEISRIGWESDVIVIDVAGADSAIARRAIAIADTLITPVNSSFVDLDLLGKFHPTSLKVMAEGCFAIAVNEIRAARLRRGMPDLDWVVAQNRVRRGASQNQSRIEAALLELAPEIGFRLVEGLAERVAYRELFLLGLTHLDLRRIPEFARTKTDANREILGFVTDLALCQSDRHASERHKPRLFRTGLPGVAA
jgi:chromosome partitioning protein